MGIPCSSKQLDLEYCSCFSTASERSSTFCVNLAIFSVKWVTISSVFSFLFRFIKLLGNKIHSIAKLLYSDVSRLFGNPVYRFGHPSSGTQKRFLTSFFSVAIQQRNTLKKSKWLRRQKINRRRRIERRDCLQKCFHSFK